MGCAKIPKNVSQKAYFSTEFYHLYTGHIKKMFFSSSKPLHGHGHGDTHKISLISFDIFKYVEDAF
jgi:hypothetical protein